MAYYKCSGHDTSRVTATAAGVLAGKSFVKNDGNIATGSLGSYSGGGTDTHHFCADCFM